VVLPLGAFELTNMEEKKKRFSKRKMTSHEYGKSNSPKKMIERSKTKTRPAKIETKMTHLQIKPEEIK